jgi:hypothetical protein
MSAYSAFTQTVARGSGVGAVGEVGAGLAVPVAGSLRVPVGGGSLHRVVIYVCGDLVQRPVGITACRVAIEARGWAFVGVWSDPVSDLPALHRVGLSKAILDISRRLAQTILMTQRTYTLLGPVNVGWLKETVTRFGGGLEIVPDSQDGAV